MLNLEDIIKTVIANHPKDCIFHPDTVKNVMAIVKAINPQTIDGLINVLETAIVNNEIYCPHEGIDRRKEFGIATMDFI